MRIAKLTGFLALILLVIFFAACERKVVVENGAITNDEGQALPAFVGSPVCSTCHAGTYEDFIKTGHPYKLNKASEARIPGYYPYTVIPGVPDLAPINGDWDNVSYVIGGHRWKARFIDLQGYIITGLAVQYNFETEEWVAYHSSDSLGTKKYDCGTCHTTNYKPEGNQDGLPGLVGTWDAGGIQCEECHGNGSFHVKDPYNVQMTIDRSSNACGQCHVRGTPYMIPASGDFVKHHEQYNEIVGSKHGPIDCVECHDPHKTLHPSEPNREDAIRQQCESCHFDQALAYRNSEIDDHPDNDVECIDCHMPRLAKSAVGQTDILDGDVRTHVFTVNTEADAEQFYTIGSNKFSNPYLTLNYMCKSCHSDKDQEWMAANAHQVHKHDES